MVSVKVLLSLGYVLYFYGDVVDIYHDDILTTSNIVDANVWHARLGYIEQEIMKRLAKEWLLSPVGKIELTNCEHCLAEKITKKPFGKGTKADYPLQLVHSDICSPMLAKTRHGAYYFTTFMDDYTQFGYIYLFSHKLEALYCFKYYINLVKNQLDKRIKTLRTN